MYGLEKTLIEQLELLRDKYRIEGIKAEFEAEGSSFNDLVRLRRLTDKAGLKLMLKIGGVEAIRDIKDSVEIGVDGLISPMVESKFGLKKFLDAYESIYHDNRIHLSINIETRNAVEQINEILSLAIGNIDNITIGRTDLSASYLDPKITPDCEFINGIITEIGTKATVYGLSVTVGGSVSARSVENFLNHSEVIENVRCIESRKVIMPRDTFLNNDQILLEALRFEELYILSKKEISDVMIEAELERLSKLTARAPKTVTNAA